MGCGIDRKQIHGAVPFKSSTMGVVDASDSCLDLCFRALGVAAVIGHVQYAACLELGQNGGILLYDEEHGARFVAPNLELVQRMWIVYGKFDAVKASGLHGLINFFYGSGVHFNGSHVNSSGVQWSAQRQIGFLFYKANMVPLFSADCRIYGPSPAPVGRKKSNHNSLPVCGNVMT
jgi:hypothetical protein